MFSATTKITDYARLVSKRREELRRRIISRSTTWRKFLRKELWAFQTVALGSEAHPDLVDTLWAAGDALCEIHYHETALQMYKKALAMQRGGSFPEDRRVDRAQSFIKMGNAYSARSKLSITHINESDRMDAKDMYKKAREVYLTDSKQSRRPHYLALENVCKRIMNVCCDDEDIGGALKWADRAVDAGDAWRARSSGGRDLMQINE